MLQFLFFLSIGILVYVYFLYPFLIWFISLIHSREIKPDGSYLPSISLIIAAYNEENVIEEKIRNSLNLNYPKEKLEIIIVSDGSEDATNHLVKKYRDKGVILFEKSPRGGKTRALIYSIPKSRNNIVILSDANTMYHPNSIRELVRYMKDKRVGAVTGDVKIINESNEFGRQENLYYLYERFIQLCESKIGSIIGVDGAMYALRKEAYLEPSPDIVLDDFVISMNAIRKGYRVIYNPRALAWENATPSVKQEIRRRKRITAGAIQGIIQNEGIPGSTQIVEWLMYISHKLLRWFTSFFMLVILLSNFLLLGSPLWNLFFLLQIAFYLLVMLGWILAQRALPAFLKIPFYFFMVNYAALIGIFKGLFGMQKVTWAKADRNLVRMPKEETQ
ncbi:MAG: glycosyltransferase family 2 protein [Calditrichia bacterium]